jgi:hypothetical protein
VKQRSQQRPRPRLVDDDSSGGHHNKQQQKPQRREPSPCLQVETFEPRSPSSPPPSSTGLDVDSPVVEQPWTTVDYGNLPTPKKGKRVVIKKPRLQVQENA